MSWEPSPPRYAPFYCEENVWQLCRARADAGLSGVVALITNKGRSCALWSQRAAPQGKPAMWDYHVVLIGRSEAGSEVAVEAGGWLVWDLDTRLGCPVGLMDYLSETFAPPGAIQARFEPRFRIIAMADYLARFSSDRSHMRGRHGELLHPEPQWPAIVRAGEPSFLRWLDEPDTERRYPGRFLSLGELEEAAFTGSLINVAAGRRS